MTHTMRTILLLAAAVMLAGCQPESKKTPKLVLSSADVRVERVRDNFIMTGDVVVQNKGAARGRVSVRCQARGDPHDLIVGVDDNYFDLEPGDVEEKFVYAHLTREPRSIGCFTRPDR